MSRTKSEFGPTQINKSAPVDLGVELNSPNIIQFEPKQIAMSVVFRPSVKMRYNTIKNICFLLRKHNKS